jgi:hypothetical protein
VLNYSEKQSCGIRTHLLFSVQNAPCNEDTSEFGILANEEEEE